MFDTKTKLFSSNVVLWLVAFGIAVSPSTFAGGMSPQLEEKLDKLQASVDALSPSPLMIFPGDGIDGPPLAYMDNGDGTVTDMNTGLMWEVKVPGGDLSCSTITDLHAVDATCLWPDAAGAWIDAVNTEGDTGFAGYNDWRFPNVRELNSIVDYSRHAPSISPMLGPTAVAYWSSTSQPEDFAAWIVQFRGRGVPGGGSGGKVDLETMATFLSMRAVRGGR